MIMKGFKSIPTAIAVMTTRAGTYTIKAYTPIYLVDLIKDIILNETLENLKALLKGIEEIKLFLEETIAKKSLAI